MVSARDVLRSHDKKPATAGTPASCFAEAAATDPGTICRLNLSLPPLGHLGVLAVQQTGTAGPVARFGLLDHQPGGFQHRQVLAHSVVVEAHVPGQLADTDWPGRLADHLLDWFHLTMRITEVFSCAQQNPPVNARRLLASVDRLEHRGGIERDLLE